VWLGRRHTTTYRKIDVERSVCVGSSFLTLTLSRTCDLVGKLDLVLPPGAPPIKSVAVEIGGERIDAIDLDATLVDALCAVHDRRSAVEGRMRFVPLVLAPFHSWNLLPLVALQHQPVQIRLRVLRRPARAARARQGERAVLEISSTQTLRAAEQVHVRAITLRQLGIAAGWATLLR
jgi:hypothetical protein